MKRQLPVVALASIALAAAGAGSAYGFASEYTGEVKDDPPSDMGFNIDRAGGGDRKVVEFTSVNIQFECEIGTPGRTDGPQQLGKMRVKDDGSFKGSDEVVGIPADPHGKVTGKLRRGGKAVGTLRLRGELDGNAGSDCDTGTQDWKAEKIF